MCLRGGLLALIVHSAPCSLSPIEAASSVYGNGYAWLDGHAEHELGRYSYVAWNPVETLTLPHGDGLLPYLDQFSFRKDADVSFPRWIGAVAYDAAWSTPTVFGIRKPSQHKKGGSIAVFHRYEGVYVYDHLTHAAQIISETESDLKQRVERLSRAETIQHFVSHSGLEVAPDDAQHESAIHHALSEIKDGNFYQINLARKISTKIHGSGFSLFLSMRNASPVPLGAHIVFQDGTELLCRSMELFLSWDASTHTIESRPIKGTINSLESNPSQQLIHDPKEQAEHNMIVDLIRNDLGRIAEPKSVKVIEPHRAEPYKKLFHLVSTVQATCTQSLSEIFSATFPPGSVTGAPKCSAVEWIEHLETCSRGFYTGCMGYLDHHGGFKFNVAIRTATLHPISSQCYDLEYFAGGGIVESSIPEKEVAETWLKTAVLKDALGL